MTVEIERETPNQTSWITGNQFIGGQWRAGNSPSVLKVSNPFSGEQLLELRQADTSDLDDAFSSAEAAGKAWAATSPAARQKVMLKAAQIMETRREEIISWLIAESGSTVLKANIELGAAIGITIESASFPHRVQGRILESNTAGKENRVYRRPLGVVGVISPWNFPLHLTQRSIAPALALGNAVVIKPASDTPVTGGLVLAKVFEEAGLPAGVLNVVIGAGSEIGDAFVEHPVPSFISFTGSTPVGQNVARLASSSEHLKHVALELGGNSPFVVLADADIDQAVRAAAMGKFLHQGQICMAINRIIVDDAVHDEFVEKFAARVRNLPVGNPADPATIIGPVINSKQLQGLQEKIRLAQEQGARTVLDGQVNGNVLPPHIFADVNPDMEIAREEIFGPLVGILRARDEHHALQLANDSSFGLSSAVFTGSPERGVAFAKGIKAGMTHINDIPVNDEPHVAFGGEKSSGLGRFNGEWAIQEFTTDHWVSVQSSPRQYPF
ncbi:MULTISPECIES: aldehyde dehydrogenase family protein [unclassified Arthrobacter]|jgi:aldehyde dehydrogenase (NAD+)|uniref:aldehyde dehydrogenase family protein n=1 Tax=unclassified Arthrobacter TaxID=235627 RepID=UPI0009E6D366|nr:MULTISPECIES: aldehyde dehydrogenase family protein [unclassified Arthrobacter]TDT78341.1 aldehyde dehydrogenase (NAD+) [Arthrobacter sp. AG258]TWD56095.1 aldehyde dehydrogenase (NAD+) [Arthrobacter sp. AG367]